MRRDVFRLRTDMDKGDGRTRYVLRGEGAGSVFVIDEKTGNIHVTKPLDREEKDEYRLVATATDRQTDRALEPSSQFIIRVQDINDNPPIFQDGPYGATIPEMANIGTSIIQVTATDADDPTYGNSAKLVYTLTQGQQYFSVDPQTGILRTAVPDMDRETQDQYLVVLQAKDMGGHLGGLSGTTTVTVRLSDVNDNPPRFTHSSWSFSVSELALPGAEVGRLSATDADLGDNAKMEFGILDGEGSDTFNITGLEHEAVITLNKSDPETLFRIAPDSGLITTAAELDREHERWHNITVIATQRDSPTQVSRAVVAIETLDVNDNAPELDRQYSAVLCDSAAVGQVVQVLRAVDKDRDGNDSVVHFSIAPESRASRNFSIRESGGPTASLVLQSPLPPLSRSPASILALQVPLVLRDGDSNLSSTGTLTVSVCPCVTGSGKEATCLPLPSASPLCPLPAVSALSLSLRRQKRDSLSPLEEDDVRENIITYDDEGGGEADTAAFDIAALQSAPHSARRGYRTLDSRNIRYTHQNQDRCRTSPWAQNPGLDPHFPLQEATLYGRLFYSSHTLPVLRSVHGPFEPGLSFPGALDPSLVLQNQALDKPGTSKEGSEGQGPGAEPTRPGSAATGTESAGDGHQGEPFNPPEGTLDFAGLELGSTFVGPRPELEGGISVTGTTCSLYQEGVGFIADWRNRMGIGGYVLGRREMIPQLLGGRGRSMEAGGGGASSLALKVGEFLRLRLAQVTFDPSLPPYDSVQIYGFEGEGSRAGSLSSLGSEGDKEAGGDWGGGPAHWGPQFQRLAELLQGREREPPEEREGEREPPGLTEENGEEPGEKEKPAESRRDGEGEEGASME
ncbi:hypothetical protein Z043_122821 [Scleropages formosus]|uniref:Cadherin domain-containing protein n=1 Tax=Scleropages formosus TaxID=113540 RepID=A0A0P7TNC9_SCLFO|nr:hypothetical protein Z043_122821 [Scleropages formosus]